MRILSANKSIPAELENVHTLLFVAILRFELRECQAYAQIALKKFANSKHLCRKDTESWVCWVVFLESENGHPVFAVHHIDGVEVIIDPDVVLGLCPSFPVEPAAAAAKSASVAILVFSSEKFMSWLLPIPVLAGTVPVGSTLCVMSVLSFMLFIMWGWLTGFFIVTKVWGEGGGMSRRAWSAQLGEGADLLSGFALHCLVGGVP